MLLNCLILLTALISNGEEVSRIDRQIEELRDLQETLRWSAQKNVNNAMRWQFQSENYTDARRAWDQAAEEKQKIKEIEGQIEDLERKKQAILNEGDGKLPPK